MKKLKIIYHIGDKPTIKTKVKKGVVCIGENTIVLHSKTDGCDIMLNDIKNLSLFKLNGLGSMLRLEKEGETLFLSVVRFCIGQFAVTNFLGTGKLKTAIEKANNLSA